MRAIILVLVCLCYNLKAKSQTLPPLQISGKVVDSASQKPLDYATVVLKNDKRVSIKSVLTKTNGAFVLLGVKPGNYAVTVVSVGYRPVTIPIKLTESLDLGTIAVKASTEKLKEVVITADRPLMRQEIDRISYDVKADPESRVNSVLEMMRKVPLLSLDADDNIQLQGDGNFKILINGKPSGMVERNPKDILRSMPASSIEKIEVITTPPAKYDGEGLAGIINIVTTKKADNGYNASVNVSERFPVGGPGAGGSVTVKSGKLGISAMGGVSQNKSPETINTYSRQTDGTNPTRLFQAGSRTFSGNSGYGGAELSFEIDSLNLISGQINYNGNISDNRISQNSELNGSTAILQRYDLQNLREASGDGVDAALNYQLGFKNNKNRLLTLSYRYFGFSNTQLNNVSVFNPVSYEKPDFRQDNTGGSTEQTVQVDYVHPIKKITMELGAKAIFRTNASDYQSEIRNASGLFEPDPLQTNRFNNTQDVLGIYNTWQFSVGSWGVKAGMRVEKTFIEADFISAGARIEQDFLNVIPSVSVNRRFKNMSSINFGFSSRIQRPGINQLNPFVDRSNPNVESTGNPDLRPMTGNIIEVNYSRFKKATVTVGTRLIIFNDLIMSRVTVDPQTSITHSSFGNTGDARMFATNINLNYPVTKALKLTLSGNLNHGKVSGEVNGVMLRNQAWMTRVFASTGYRFEKGWQANASMNYNGPGMSLQARTNSFFGSSFSVSKEFLDNKLSFSAAANNVFSKYRNAFNYTNGTGFSQETFNQSYFRNFTTSINYRFGKLKDKIKKNKRGISNNDVSDDTGGL